MKHAVHSWEHKKPTNKHICTRDWELLLLFWFETKFFKQAKKDKSWLHLISSGFRIFIHHLNPHPKRRSYHSPEHWETTCIRAAPNQPKPNKLANLAEIESIAASMQRGKEGSLCYQCNRGVNSPWTPMARTPATWPTPSANVIST